MNICENFIQKKQFEKISLFVMSSDMPWYWNNGVNRLDGEKYFQFTYIFMEEGRLNCHSDMMNLIKPITDKIKCKKMMTIKANLLTQDSKITEHGMHIDQSKGRTGIFYMNDCNGYTKFKNGKKIKSKANTFVEFESELEHTGSTCTDQKRRVVINFNYQ